MNFRRKKIHPLTIKLRSSIIRSKEKINLTKKIIKITLIKEEEVKVIEEEVLETTNILNKEEVEVAKEVVEVEEEANHSNINNIMRIEHNKNIKIKIFSSKESKKECKTNTQKSRVVAINSNLIVNRRKFGARNNLPICNRNKLGKTWARLSNI
jgi:hypothetical protein